jgi:anthranilate phosphoribosyltransferase
MGERTWPNLLVSLISGAELSTSDTSWAMGEVMAGEATPVQIASFMVALRAKGETPAELTGLVDAMLSAAVRVDLGETLGPELARDAVDIVGTGGDRAHTVNISTMGAIVVAGAGIRVVKHGNRAASSLCGAADLLEHVGVPLDLGPAEVARCVADAGIAFCFAPRFHSGLRHAAVARREMGIPTAFNFLGPLTNPAQPRAGAVGCADGRMAGLMASVFAQRGDSVFVMRGEDGLDEFTTAAPTAVWAVADGTATSMIVDAADLGLARCVPDDLRGGDASVNADVLHRVLAGETGPVRDAVLVNAAAAIAAYTGGDFTTADGVRSALAAGLTRAAEAVDSGAAAAALQRWITVAQGLRPAA